MGSAWKAVRTSEELVSGSIPVPSSTQMRLLRKCLLRSAIQKLVAWFRMAAAKTFLPVSIGPRTLHTAEDELCVEFSATKVAPFLLISWRSSS